MTIAPEVLDALLAAGASAEMIVAAVKADAAQGERRQVEKRAADAARQRKSRASRNVTVTPCDIADVTQSPPSLSPAPSSSPDPSNNPTPAHTPANTPRTRKADHFSLPGDIPREEWDGFEEMRRKIGKPMTDRARGLAVTELRKLSDAGWPPGEVLNHCTLNSYQGIFPPKDNRNGNSRQHHRQADQHPGGRTGAALDLVFGGMGRN